MFKQRAEFFDQFNRAWGKAVEIREPPSPPPSQSGKYRFAGRELEMLLMDFDRKGYAYDQIRSAFVQFDEPPLPDAWRDRYELALAEALEQQRNGDINDNPIVALREISPTRIGSGEPQGFSMNSPR